jgi:flagellar basal body-associated protein FliL
MIGWLIALIVVVVLFAVGAVFCAPWSPVHKKIAQAQKPGPTTELVDRNSEKTPL